MNKNETETLNFGKLLSRKLFRLYNLLPDFSLKHKIWCYNCNRKNKDIKLSYQNGYFNIALKDFSLKFYDNFFHEWHCIKGYLQEYALKQGDIILDLGAGYGDFAIYASKIIGEKGKIFAYEPDPINFEKLKRNIKLNNAKNIFPIQKILMDKKQLVEFNCLGGGASSIDLNFHGRGKVEKIQADSLDNEVKRLKLKKIDLIKMDIETAEIDVLKSCSKLMKSFNPHFAIASYHILNGKKTYVELEEIFRKRGYNCKTDYPIHLTTYAWKQNV